MLESASEYGGMSCSTRESFYGLNRNDAKWQNFKDFKKSISMLFLDTTDKWYTGSMIPNCELFGIFGVNTPNTKSTIITIRNSYSPGSSEGIVPSWFFCCKRKSQIKFRSKIKSEIFKESGNKKEWEPLFMKLAISRIKSTHYKDYSFTSIALSWCTKLSRIFFQKSKITDTINRSSKRQIRLWGFNMLLSYLRKEESSSWALTWWNGEEINFKWTLPETCWGKSPEMLWTGESKTASLAGSLKQKLRLLNKCTNKKVKWKREKSRSEGWRPSLKISKDKRAYCWKTMEAN